MRIFVADLQCNGDGALQIMYGIGGEKHLTESTLDHLAATAARSPCGSATAPSTSARTTSGCRCSTRSTCTKEPCALEHAVGLWPLDPPAGRSARATTWRHPDQGSRSRAASPAIRLLEADDPGSRSIAAPAWLAAIGGDGAAEDRLARDGRRNPRRDPRPRRARRQASSASTTRPIRSTPRPCSIPLLRFLPADDPRVRATVDAIADELTETASSCATAPTRPTTT